MNRRDILSGLGGLLALGIVGPNLRAQAAPQAAGGWPIKPLPFDPKKLKGLSEKLLVSHHDNNYAGAIKALNTVRKKLGEAMAQPDLPPFVYTGLKREQLARTGSMILHEDYFGNLGGNGKASAALKAK